MPGRTNTPGIAVLSPYWEGDYPSRVDQGKEKYGGPFTEEEEEDLKTILRLLPLLPCMTPFGLMSLGGNTSNHYKLTSSLYIHCIASNTYLFYSLMVAIAFPFYRVIVFPCFYSYTPTMLKRIDTGLFLIILGQCGYVALELVGHDMKHDTVCMFVPGENLTLSSS